MSMIGKIKRLTRPIRDWKAQYYLKAVQKRKTTGTKIRVGFVVQLPEVWDKESPVYDALRKLDCVQTVLLVVPAYRFETRNTPVEYDNNYFLSRYDDAVKALNEDGTVIDVAALKLDYVFLQRPYDHYLPSGLRSYDLVKETKCCYIPYGFSGADVFNNGNSNPEFFRYIYATFLESGYMQNILATKFRKTAGKGLQHFEFLGYPALEPYRKMGKPENIKTVLWTPRWSYDERLGGSHFFEYKDAFINIKRDHPELNLIFRPHPLMFEELVTKHLMTHEELDSYLKTLSELGIIYDYGAPIEESIDKADALITDFSSIIVQYYLTGKPILYCESQIKLNAIYNKLASGMYIVKNEEDIEKYVSMLLAANDYRSSIRQRVIEEEFSNCEGAADRIADWIVNDYRQV